MMGKNSRITLIFVFATLFLINGCSVVCNRLGRQIDTHNPEIVTILPREIITLSRETLVDIFLVNGEEISAKFIGFEKMLPGEYKTEYDRVKPMLQNSDLPDIGDTLEIALTDEVYRGELIGFDYSYMYVFLAGFEDPKRLPLSSVSHIMTNRGTKFESSQLAILIEQGCLPVMRVMVVDRPPDTENIFLHEIDYVQYYRTPNTAMFFGSLVGAIIDLLIITNL